ncbi:ACT domain-containing protein [Nanoarchaeota archaeon]
MAGIKDLNELLKSMKPEMKEGTYVFCTLSEDEFTELHELPELVFQEDEGITIILKKRNADKLNLEYEAEWSKITLTVHSDLEAVGFLAAISNKLAEEGISVNVISAYYHDHLFVPRDTAGQAMLVLNKLTE